MATFPPTIAQPGSPQGAGPAASPGAGGGSALASTSKLMMLSQIIQGLAKDFPQGQAGIDMMMKGLRLLQSAQSAQSPVAQPAAPPM